MARRGQGTAHGGILVKRPVAPKARPSVRDYRGQGEGAENAPAGQPGAFPGGSVTFSIPGKPLSVNAATRSVLIRGQPRALKSREARDFLERAQHAARLAMGNRPPLTGALEIITVAFWPRRGADSDAHHKQTKDSLQGIVYAKDGIVCWDQSGRDYDPENPRVEVTVRPWVKPVPVVERVFDRDEVAAMFAEASEGL